MKPIGEFAQAVRRTKSDKSPANSCANKAKTGTTEANPSRESAGLSNRQMEILWERMTEIYGHRWRSSYGSANAIRTWQKALADLTAEQLADGLKRCLTRDDPWPPTLPEFRSLCKPTAAPYHRLVKLIGKPSDPEIAKKALLRVKEILR